MVLANTQTIRHCGRCQKDLPEGAFYKSKNNPWCRSCLREYQGRILTSDVIHRNNRSPHGRYNRTKYSAEKRGIPFTLSLSQYLFITGNTCVYCGCDLPKTCGGLDRIDKSKGYEPSNVLPCCSTCNAARGQVFTPNEMGLYIGPAVRLAKEARNLELVERRLADG